MTATTQARNADGRTETAEALARRDRLVRLASYASVSAALALIASKTGAYVLTDSVSMLSSLVDSLLDLLASALTLFAVRTAQVPADEEHRFGHGKAEALAAMGQSAFVGGSAVLLLIEAIRRIGNPQVIEHGDIGIGVMLFSIVVTLALVVFQRYVISRSQSVAVSADSLHYLGDLLTNGAVIVALVLSGFMAIPLADPLFGLGIGAFIMWSAWKILRTALVDLMDRELPQEDRERIAAIVLEDKRVLAVHDLRTRSAGRDTFIQMHVEMDEHMSLREAHEIADKAELKVAKAFPGAEVLIHQDPVSRNLEQVPERITR